jgi:hippurate hydrolase
MQEYLSNEINKILSTIIDIRHQLHACPELAFTEHKTTNIISDALINFGYSEIKRFGNTGLVTVLDSGRAGKMIGLRADFDALAIQESNLLPYSSKNPGKMHACGHDGHAAILLAVAAVLAQLKDKLNGKIVFIFQPAEELGEGAKAMMDDGLLEHYALDEIYALHNFPHFSSGHIAVKEGCILAGMDAFEIEIEGKAGHASIPEKCINPIAISTQLQLELEEKMKSIIQNDPLSSLNITNIFSETSESINVIPKKVTLFGITRVGSCDTQDLVKKMIAKQATVLSNKYEAKVNVIFKYTCPPTLNTKEPVTKLIGAAKKHLGESKVKLLDHALAAYDDFAYFLQNIPGCYFFIGNGETSEMVHTDKYNFNDEIIKQATLTFVNLVIDQ